MAVFQWLPTSWNLSAIPVFIFLRVLEECFASSAHKGKQQSAQRWAWTSPITCAIALRAIMAPQDKIASVAPKLQGSCVRRQNLVGRGSNPVCDSTCFATCGHELPVEFYLNLTIFSGYYVDYNLLPSCIDKDVCEAIVECVFSTKACPGRGNKDCRSDESTCYTGFGCTRCCMYFYQSGSDCLPCPDSTISIILLCLLAMAMIVVALIVTSIQTPQLQACIKGLVVMTSFFQGFVSLKFLKI